MKKNPAAVALAKMGKGVKRNFTPSDLERRRKLMEKINDLRARRKAVEKKVKWIQDNPVHFMDDATAEAIAVAMKRKANHKSSKPRKGKETK